MIKPEYTAEIQGGLVSSSSHAGVRLISLHAAAASFRPLIVSFDA